MAADLLVAAYQAFSWVAGPLGCPDDPVFQGSMQSSLPGLRIRVTGD
jgi:hypothetical protein